MKRYLLFLAMLLSSALFLAGLCRARCPEDTGDRGECDTLHITCYNQRQFGAPSWNVYFPLLVTHDQLDWVDSITTFHVPLTWTHINPAAYCSLPPLRNNNSLTDTINSVFRDFGGMTNCMRQLAWTTRVIGIFHGSPNPFLLMDLVPSGTDDQWCGYEGSRLLLATMTFTISDTMTVCIDTVLVPAGYPYPMFCRGEVEGYRPRDNLPFCIKITILFGDANGDGEIHIPDIVYLINYLFIGGAPPQPLGAEDANCDEVINVADVVCLINYLFGDGPEPSWM